MHVFWGMKKLVQLKFVQLFLLNRVKGKMIKKPCCSRFLLHKFLQLKYFWPLFKNVHLQDPCSLRPCISRPYCTKVDSLGSLFEYTGLFENFGLQIVKDGHKTVLRHLIVKDCYLNEYAKTEQNCKVEVKSFCH